LSQLHRETESQLAAEKAQNESLHDRLSRLASDSQQASFTLSKRAEEAERELRWAQERCKSAELREELVRKELEAVRHGLGASSGGADPQRVKDLERLLEEYKQQLEEMSRDSRDLETRLAGGKGLVKRSELEDEQERCKALQSGEFS
jgi:mitotic spindle assembly checkpoint protein MAD1